MASDNDEFVTIRPRRIEPPRPESGTPPGTIEASRGTRRWPLVAVFGLLLGAIVVVFLVVPRHVPTPGVVTAPGVAAPDVPMPEKGSVSSDSATPAPFASLRADLEREKVEALLKRFVELQIRLDDEMAVGQWGAEAFAAAQRLANEGDQRFLARQYEDARVHYENGVAALEALVAQGEARFDHALARALESIARGDAEAATDAIEEAAVVHPKDPRVADTRERIARAPRVLAARLRGDDALSRGAWQDAAVAYAQALELDAGQSDLPAKIAAARARAAEAEFAAVLSDGYGALDRGDLAAAERIFRQALTRRPGDRAAEDGLAQVAQAGTLSRIDRLRAQAERQERDEQWQAACATYTEVLTVDGTLKFAADGKARCTERAAIDAALEATLSDPGSLSADRVFAEAVALYDRAVNLEEAGPRLTGQLDRLESLIATAAQPVDVVFTSDGATEVTVFQVGPIGAFSQKTVALRPGRYVVTGSRRGCRDIRLEVLVAPTMPPVDVRCTETL